MSSRPDIQVKRKLRDDYLEYVYGTRIGGDDLFFQHTYLTVVAKTMATHVLGAVPTQAEAAKWAHHFRIDDRPNHYVVIGPEALRQKTFAKIPGYWLVDKNLVLRCDATGHHPPSSLYEDLLPIVPELLDEAASAER